MEQETERAGAQSSEDASTRGVWFKERALGLVALVLVAVGQAAILLAYLFAPPDTLTRSGSNT